MMDRWFYQLVESAKRNPRIEAELWGAYRKGWRADWSPARNLRAKYTDQGKPIDVVHAWWRHPIGDVSRFQFLNFVSLFAIFFYFLKRLIV